MNVLESTMIRAGVKNLKEYGYPHVTEHNILTDIIYSAFFKTMLRETLEQVKDKKNAKEACERLIGMMSKEDI